MATEQDVALIERARTLAQSAHPEDIERDAVHGALLVRGDVVVSEGTSCRYSQSDPVRYAEMDCIANAGRRNDQAQLTLYTTGSPNWLSAGTIVQFGIGALVYAGFTGTDALDFLAQKGVELRRVTEQ